MNDLYRQIIKKNKSKLIEYTSVTPQLLAKCTQEKILTDHDAERCSKKNRTVGETNTELYNILLTKDAERYALFVKIMEEEGQSNDAIKILKQGLTNCLPKPGSIHDIPQTTTDGSTKNAADSDSLNVFQRFKSRLTYCFSRIPPRYIIGVFLIISILFCGCLIFHLVYYPKNLEQIELKASQVALPAMVFLTLENYTNYLCNSLGLNATFTFENVNHIIQPGWLETCDGGVPHHLIIKGIPSHSQIFDILSSEFKSSLKMLTLVGDSTCQEFNPEKTYCKDTTIDLLAMTDLHFVNIRKECSGLYKFLNECVAFRMRYNVALSNTRVFPNDINYLVPLQAKSGNPFSFGTTEELCEGEVCKEIFVFQNCWEQAFITV